MEVILLEDVKALGKKGQKVKVNDGYARNFILPKKLGIEATPKNLNDLKLQKANEDKLKQEQLDAAKAFAKELEDKFVVVSIKAGEGGRTFGSVSSKEIVQAAKEQLGYDLDKKKLQMPEALKALGTYNVKLKLHPKVTAELKVKVTEK
ncbi:LSU ribosomal protein L9p [Lachnospiraceae bacterium KM106-2]|nr:LSU ribosomal protein L9p [Lachnospiraceae bacterium KM106-2]